MSITRQQAVEIGRRALNRPEPAGIFVADRGDHYFIGPPIKSAKALERAGVCVDKHTGEITSHQRQR